MVESRWVRWIGPGLLALGAVGSITSATLGAADRPWAPRACAGQPGDRIAAARGGGVAMAALPREAWFRLDPDLDADGALRGQHLRVGVGRDRLGRRLDLPAESFVAGPFGRVVLVGADDGTVSRIEGLDVANGCSWALATEPEVIRRATVDRAGAWIYEARVERSTRADLGVWRRPMDDGEPSQRVLPPLRADERFGRTFSTEFAWDVAGERLAVQSCGEIACRTRIIGSAGGPAPILDQPDLGPFIGFDGDRFVSYLACRGLPCPIVSTDLTTGGRRALTSAGALAALVVTPQGTQVVHEATTSQGRRLVAIDLATARAVDLGPLPDGLSLHPSVSVAASGTRVPDGWALLSPDGRMPSDRSTIRPLLRRIADGTTVQFDEVAR